MSLLRINEESASVVYLEPGFVPGAAVVVCLFAGSGFAAAAATMYARPVQMVVMMVASCAFFLTALLVRSQRRRYEVNTEDRCFYVIGRQKPDMYTVAFDDIAALRIARRTREIAPPPSRRHRPDDRRPEERRRTEYYLDLLFRDSGYETLDRSVTADEIVRLAHLLAERTGLPVTDEAELDASRDAAVGAAASDTRPVPDTPPPGSCIAYAQDRQTVSCVWTASPGAVVLFLMGMVGVGMLGIGALGILELLREDGSHWVGITATVVSGVLAYQISWRFMYGVFCNTYVVMDHDGLHSGYYCLNNDRHHVTIALHDIVGFRVVAPRYRRCRLEALTRSGDVHVLASLNPGLYPLTVGDLHWMSAHFDRLLREKFF